MIGVAHNYVVEHFYFQKLASADEVAGNIDVRFTGGAFAARVVVHEDKGGGGSDDR